MDFGTGTAHTIWGVSAVSLKTFAGGGTIDMGTATIAIKWMDVTFDVTTGGTGCTVNFTGNMTIDAWTVSAGDALSCTVAGTTITGVSNKAITFNSSSVTTFTGTSGNNVTITGMLGIVGNGTCNWQYLTISSNQGANALAFSSTTVGTTLDNLTLTNSARNAIYVASGTITITNSTLSGVDGATWVDQDIVLGTNASLQLSSCTFTTVGMQATSGWLISKNHNGVSGAYRMYGIANYNAADSSYRSTSSDNVTLMNADAYSTSFNTSLTYNVAAAAKSLTINPSTTATVNALITLTCCTVVNNGTFTLNGILACGGILFPKYVLDADSMMDTGNMLDSNAVLQVMV
jgi:hypothetical protein